MMTVMLKKKQLMVSVGALDYLFSSLQIAMANKVSGEYTQNNIRGIKDSYE